MAKTTDTSRSRTRSREELEAERRKIRSDLGAMKSVMDFPEGYDNFHFRWVNDVEDGHRVSQFLKLGWKVWDQDTGYSAGDPNTAMESNLDGESGARLAVGQGVTAVLMYIDKELWDIDQDLKEKSIRKTEEAMGQRFSEQGLAPYGAQKINRGLQSR